MAKAMPTGGDEMLARHNADAERVLVTAGDILFGFEGRVHAVSRLAKQLVRDPRVKFLWEQEMASAFNRVVVGLMDLGYRQPERRDW